MKQLYEKLYFKIPSLNGNHRSVSGSPDPVNTGHPFQPEPHHLLSESKETECFCRFIRHNESI